MVSRDVMDDNICYLGTEIETTTDATSPNYRPVSRHTTTTALVPISEHVDSKFLEKDTHVGATAVSLQDTATPNTITLSIHHLLQKSNSDVYENI